MARPWRIQFEDAVYHVSCRGNARQDIFADDSDRGYLLFLLGRAAERFGLEFFGFCLMPNHYHLFLRTPRGNLSQAMHWINAGYTIHFNWRHQRIGHLFQGRFKSVLVVDDTHYMHLSMYVHLNPVRAGLVEDPADFRWSSYRDYISRERAYAWLNREEILGRYGDGARARLRYRRDSLAMIGKTPGFVEQLRRGFAIGPAEKIIELARKHQPAGDRKQVPQFVAASKICADPAAEIARVARAFNVDQSELFKKRRGFIPRLVAYLHLVENCGIKVHEVERIFGLSTGAVSHGITRLKENPQYRKTIKNKIEGLPVKSYFKT